MELLETNQCYRLFTKNSRSVGTVVYHKGDDSEDIVFRPYFHKEGDPWIGVLYESMEKDDWKTSRELFGRYLDDPHFRIDCPTISFVIRPEITAPGWMGGAVLILVEFDNDGTMTCKYGAEKTGCFMSSSFKYEGEINLQDTVRFAYEKIKEDAPKVEFLINHLSPPSFIQFLLGQENEDKDNDEDDDD